MIATTKLVPKVCVKPNPSQLDAKIKNWLFFCVLLLVAVYLPLFCFYKGKWTVIYLWASQPTPKKLFPSVSRYISAIWRLFFEIWKPLGGRQNGANQCKYSGGAIWILACRFHQISTPKSKWRTPNGFLHWNCWPFDFWRWLARAK